MSVDIKSLTYAQLATLDKEIKAALEDRVDEAAEAKTEWLKSEKGGGRFLGRIAELKNKFEKIAARCNKTKSITFRIKMDVNITPIEFDSLLQNRYEIERCEVFQSECNGELLNPKDCGNLASDIQDQIDYVMPDVCGNALEVHGSLADDIEYFMEDWNAFLEEFEDDGSKFGLVPGDIIRAHSKKKAAKAKSKRKK